MSVVEDLCFYKIVQYKVTFWMVLLVVLPLHASSLNCTDQIDLQTLYNLCQKKTYCRTKYPIENIVEFEKTFTSFHSPTLNEVCCAKNETPFHELLLKMYDGPLKNENVVGIPIYFLTGSILVAILIHGINQYYHYQLFHAIQQKERSRRV